MKFQILFSIFCLFFLSCTKRPNEEERRFKHNFKQGTADHLYNISELLGKAPVLESEEKFFAPLLPEGSREIFSQISAPLSSKGGYSKNLLKKNKVSDLLKIRTVERGEKVSISLAQEDIYIDPKISFINKYEILDYDALNAGKTKNHAYIAQLLGKVKKFKGFPDTTYYILPLFVGNYFMLYKVGPADKIPYDELPLARRVGDMVAVPFIGYPVKYCIAKVVPDINLRETGQYKPKCEGIKLEQAEYIELKESGKKVFNYIDKPDIFPRDFFELKGKHKWFYVRTIVKSPESKEVGHPLFQPASLVEFHLSEGGTKLDVLDASGYNIRPADRIRALFIPVEWTDYQIKRDSENLHSSFGEEPKKELKKDIHSKNLRYFKIKFDDLVTNKIEFGGKKTLKNVFITNNYFSFDVEIIWGKKAYLIKFAFFKKSIDEAADYVPKQWFEEDSALFFPSFYEKRRYYKSSLDHSAEDQDRFLRTTRFNPKIKEIKWYFSKQTPKDPEHEWVREMGKLAVELINEAFERIGGDKLKVVLDPNEEKEVGDTRYNILNLIVTKGKSGAGLLGLGPNVANPITGEVVSATANVWVSNMLNIYIDVVRRYIRYHVYPPSWTMYPFSQDVVASIQNQIDEKNPKCEDTLQPFGATPFLHEKIQSVCEEVTDFIEEKKSEGLIYDPENPDLQDKDIIKSCAKKLAFLPLLGITLHEILHGFGQRHIFSASVDTESFYEDYSEIEEIFGSLVSDKMKELFGDYDFTGGTNCHPKPPQYSSVMDYMDLYNPILFVPGKLDIAALRFLYFDQVEKAEGGFLDVPSGADRDENDPQKSILKTAEETGHSIKNYKVLCGGGKVDGADKKGETDPNQPLCAIFDYGAKPFDIAVNSILKINNDLNSHRYRYDSAGVSSVNFSYFINQRLGSLYKKWEQYRDELLNQKDKSIEDYSFLNPEHVTKYTGIIEKEMGKNSAFKMYYDIREPVFDYFKRLFFMPVKHCIYKDWLGSGKLHAVALENIITKEKADYITYPEDSREKVIHCQSSVVKKWAEGKGEFVSEVGFFGKSRSYLLRPKSELDNNDVSSVFYFLSGMLNETEANPFAHIILDPEFGEQYYHEVRDYLLKGGDLKPYITAKDLDILKDKKTGQIQLNRILSYKIDQEIQSKSNFQKRLSALESAIKRLRGHIAREEFDLQFGWEDRDLIDLGLSTESIEGDYPFFTQTNKEYENRPLEYIPEASLISFIKNHPASLYNSVDSSLIVIPYKDTDKNFPALLFRRYNEFMTCIKNQKRLGVVCEDIEEKRAYMEFILDYYY
ncbi:MAG: hypothetical protein OXJ52_09820 [Oligoflexia bacterium]|nr:hypothetical protein [Oligoflexia bacterium]